MITNFHSEGSSLSFPLLNLHKIGKSSLFNSKDKIQKRILKTKFGIK